MSEHRANLTLTAVTVTVAFAGFATLAVGAWPLSLGLLAVAGVLLASQRSTLAQSLHTERRDRRRHLLLGAIVAIAVFACLVAVYLADIGDDHVGNGALIGLQRRRAAQPPQRGDADGCRPANPRPTASNRTSLNRPPS